MNIGDHSIIQSNHDGRGKLQEEQDGKRKRKGMATKENEN